jgi:hypothetical protein
MQYHDLSRRAARQTPFPDQRCPIHGTSVLQELERENAELKKVVADQTLDIRMLKDVNSRKW